MILLGWWLYPLMSGYETLVLTYTFIYTVWRLYIYLCLVGTLWETINLAPVVVNKLTQLTFCKCTSAQQ